MSIAFLVVLAFIAGYMVGFTIGEARECSWWLKHTDPVDGATQHPGGGK